jgi:AraC-like DNA-binding protein
MSTSELIRNIRLKRAAQILEQGSLNISEVAYHVGFQDTGYFRKCFKNQFAVTPSSYQKNGSAVNVSLNKDYIAEGNIE